MTKKTFIGDGMDVAQHPITFCFEHLVSGCMLSHKNAPELKNIKQAYQQLLDHYAKNPRQLGDYGYDVNTAGNNGDNKASSLNPA